jgi:alpha/beta superfamily hydrolase
MPRRIETLFIAGPEGRLEALLEEPEHGEPRYAALVCHPHPLYGGTMHNKVVYRIARGLRKSRAVVLRFNFRGVNLSEGVHAHGEGEVEDARAALGFLRSRYPDLPWMLAGFSFGSRAVLRLGCSITPPPARILAAGFPTKGQDFSHLAACGVPKVFVQSTHDEHGPKLELEAVYPKFAEPKEIHWVEAKDHFFVDALDAFEAVVIRYGALRPGAA